MIRASSPLIMAAIALTVAAPAFAGKLSIQKGQNICEAAASQQIPGAKFRVDKDEVKATSTSLKYTLHYKQADGTKSKIACSVDHESETASIEGAPVALQASAGAANAN